MIKNSVGTLLPRFSALRMVREYLEKTYVPGARRSVRLNAEDYAGAKALADWKAKITSRFATVRILSFRARGLRGDSMKSGEEFHVDASLSPGRLAKDEIRVELVVATIDDANRPVNPEIVPMNRVAGSNGEGVVRYSGSYRATRAGRFIYGVRVLPSHPDLVRYQELGLVHWG